MSSFPPRHDRPARPSRRPGGLRGARLVAAAALALLTALALAQAPATEEQPAPDSPVMRVDTPAPRPDAPTQDETAPGATDRDATEPDVTEPDVAEPDATAPDTTAPDEAPGDGPTPGDAAPDDAAPDDAGPAEATQDDAAPALEATLEDGVVVARRDGRPAWRWRPSREAGDPTAPLVDGDRLLLAQGLYLLTLDGEDGTVLARAPLPAPATELARDGDAVTVTVRHADGTSASLPVEAGAVPAPVRFGTVPEAFGGLQAAARTAVDPAAAYERDPTDPWPALRRALDLDADEGERDALLDEATARAAELPFFEAARLALALLDAGEPARFEAAMDAALADLAERGYDPRLLTDPLLRSAYGLPHDALVAALDDGALERARTVAPYAWRLASEEAPATVEALGRYADALRADGAREEAELWRGRVRDLQRAGLTTWVDALAQALARLGWAGVTGLLAAAGLLWLVLLAKVWRAQTLARRQRRERGQASHPLTRLWVPRHASTTEKLVLVLLLVLAGFQATLAGWHQGADEVPAAFRSGTLASGPAVEAAEALPDTPYAWLIRGVSLAQRGERAAAEAAWRDAGELAPALVNRAVLAENASDRDALLEAALRLDPREPVGRWLAGRAADPSPFHAEVAPDAPLWSVPSPLETRLATAGDWRTSLRRAATAPWRALPEARPEGFPVWGWWAVLLLGASLLVALVVALVVPRPRVSRDAPRTPLYHLLALLVPGAGHADELWGLLLLAPWALLGADALIALREGAGPLGLPLSLEAWILAGLYAINLVGFVVEASSYRRRMWLLRERRPELARSYGLPPAPPPAENA
jgi:hypothetical protein